MKFWFKTILCCILGIYSIVVC